MRITLLIAALLVVGAVCPNHTTAQQAPPATTMTIDALVERIMKSESGLTARMRAFRPIVEVYVQNVAPHGTLGTVPVKDEYFLGQFEWSDLDGPTLKRLTPEKRARQQMSEWLGRPFGLQLNPAGFASMTVPDWRLMTGSQYTFTFLRREFLGEIRCLVLDVQPRGDSRDGFTGRIWVEELEFNIVRFNGITRSLMPGRRSWFNVDSWRVSVFPGLWLPSYVYAELEQESGDSSRHGPKIKSQVRLWGYDLKSVRPQQEFTTIQIGESTVRDSTEHAQQLSPTLSQRRWEQQAEENVLERLAKAGLLAPSGEVDKVLETVATNLLITNNLAVEPGVRARVLLTSPLDSFTVGRTIVLSRGLIDVLPDEASLAMMLAHDCLSLL